MSKITALTVPKWGLSMEEGTLVNWLVNEGDTVNPGDAVAEIESSKIVNTLETHVAGVIYRQVAKQDDTLPVGGLLAVIAEAGIPDDEIDAYINNFTSSSLATKSGDVIKTDQANVKQSEPAVKHAGPADIDTATVPEHLKQGPDDSNVPAAPHARRLAKKLGINLNNVSGSGRNGRISVADIEQAINSAVAVPVNTVQEIPMSGTRQTIARRLQESKSTIPHYRLIKDVRVDALMSLRSELNNSLPDSKVSVNDMLIKACATALSAVPDCNVQMENNVIRKFQDADIAMAVALESGLITPIIRSANRKGVVEIAVEARELIDKARNGKLSEDEINGGTFTVSNLGMYGIKQFDAIINPPQCAILAVGGAERRVVVDGDQPVIATLMTLSLSLDHRVIDGAIGSRFMQELAQAIEQPVLENYK